MMARYPRDRYQLKLADKMAKYIDPSGRCGDVAPICNKDIKSEGVIQRNRRRTAIVDPNRPSCCQPRRRVNMAKIRYMALAESKLLQLRLLNSDARAGLFLPAFVTRVPADISWTSPPCSSTQHR
jgi:hypothetical protein